jgi:1,4-dihydroxy-2-naphthoate octaprenyltransferase
MLKSYIKAARLRTLPLSVSGIIAGTLLAASMGHFDLWICILAILTTIGFQIISNFANDYGDGVKGTDNEDRIGPDRMVQSGRISPASLLRIIKITIAVTFVIAVVLIYRAFGTSDLINIMVFGILGVASIVAAMKYTMGRKAYGYYGLGDFFVFLFFGLLSVAGSYYLYTKKLDLLIFLPAFAIGFLSIGVLNLNNMRDIASDKNSGKNTLVVKIGSKMARYYHLGLLIGAFLLAVLHVVLQYSSPIQFLFVLAFIPIVKHGFFVSLNKDPEKLDPELKKLALSTFLFACLFGLGYLL